MTVSDTQALPHALYVFAHPAEHSLNRHLFDAARAELENTHTVATSDLYKMGFQPLLSPADLEHATDSGAGFLENWIAAQHAGELPADVRAEQQKLFDADLLVIQFPLWWYGVPAMLKGWIDRVFGAGLGTDGVDSETGLPERYGAGRLAGKRALLIVTAGEDARTLGPRGISGDLDSILFGLRHGTLFYSGIDPYETHAIFNADGLDPEGVAAEVTRLRTRIAGLATEEPVRFRTLRSGDYRPARALREEFAPGRRDLEIHRA
ncbi:NAD(P)H-dependent oxidoreductase [Mycetocola spongiae]|uniref:NAD(P)H-dependent oxidoreductase n=1 Tax=Mycetocola spongiae TaxID=2859226 RepID=UPI001CF4C8B8|nr:NAD(P)H-dependent oxidoreductase [Mycetocola spongiae]UCR89011.1 NAD(P)H-dependent oxidoreductase [Mycetocola spongiae]